MLGPFKQQDPKTHHNPRVQKDMLHNRKGSTTSAAPTIAAPTGHSSNKKQQQQQQQHIRSTCGNNIKTTRTSFSFSLLPMYNNNNNNINRPMTTMMATMKKDDASKGYRRRKGRKWLALSASTVMALATIFLFVLLFYFVFVRDIQSLLFSSSKSSSSLKHFQQRQQQRLTLKQQLQLQVDAFYDVVIVGAGPAGLTAALFCGRAALKTLVAGSSRTGQLSESLQLDNFPSFRGDNDKTNGEIWLQHTQQQVIEQQQQQQQQQRKTLDFLQPGLRIQSLVPYVFSSLEDKQQQQQQQQTIFKLQIDTPSSASSSSSSPLSIAARSVIIATGASPRKLYLPHEQQLWGKSVHSCAICDGSSYRQSKIVVVGGGDAAMDAVLLLASDHYQNHVTIVHRQTTFRASNRRSVEQVMRMTTTAGTNADTNTDSQNPMVHIESPSVVREYEVNSKNQLVAVHVQDVHNTSKTKRLPCDAVFLMIGSTPNTEWLRDSLELDKEGLIVLDNSNNRASSSRQRNNKGATITTTQTTIEGIFAAGEVTDTTYRQAITAAAAGAQAAIDSERWLRSQPSSLESFIHNKIIAERSGQLPLEDLQQQQQQQQQQHDNSAADIETNKYAENGTQESNMIQNQETNNKAASQYDCDLTTQSCIKSLVSKYPVVVFSKPTCKFCRKALEMLAADGLAAESEYLHVVQLTDFEESTMRQIQAELGKMTGRITVPNVFINSHSIGGGDDTVELHTNGKLRALLEKAGALLPTPPASSKKRHECDDLTSENCINEFVKQFPVVVFSKSYCPFCRKALEALRAEGVYEEKDEDGKQRAAAVIRVIELSDREDGGAGVQAMLQKMTGRRTVPNVFIGGKSIGGGDETVALHRKGKLGQLLKEAKAIK